MSAIPEMSNATVVRRHREFKHMSGMLNKLRKQRERLSAQIAKYDAKCSQLSRVDEIYGRVALEIRESENGKYHTWTFHAVGSDITRGAHVYRNQHNGDFYGVRIWTNDVGREGEVLLGMFPLAEALTIAREWIAKSKRPAKQDRYPARC